MTDKVPIEWEKETCVNALRIAVSSGSEVGYIERDERFICLTRDLYLSRNRLYLLSPRLCSFIVLKRDFFVSMMIH